MKVISVLQVGKYYPPYSGGMETVLKIICEGISNKVCLKLLVSNTKFSTQIENHGFPLYKAGRIANIYSLSICPSFPRWIKKLDSDIIHIHVPNPLAELSYLVNNLKGKLIVHFHSDIVRQKIFMPIYKSVLLKFFDKAEAIIIPTPNHLKYSKFLKNFSNKCSVIPFGIDVNAFKFSQELSEEKEKKKSKEDLPILLFVGRLVYYKGLDYLITAMNHINAKLFIVGQGPLEKQLVQLVKSLKIEDKVFFLGNLSQTEMIFYYHFCDVFVLPSIASSEMFGVVQLEAMACGKPVLSTDLKSGVPWVNQHEKTGLVVPPKNVGAIVDAVNLLLMNDDLRNLYGMNGKKRVEELFTLESMTDKILKLYKTII